MRAAAVLFGFLIGVTSVGATQFRSFDRETQIRESELVVVGRVLTMRSLRDARRSIVTDVEVAVAEAWKGLPEGERLLVRVPGGRVDGVELVVQGAPRFRPGEAVVLFLDRDGERWRPWGMAFGKYAVEGSGDGRFLVGHLPPVVSGPQDFEAVSVALDELRREVKDAAAGGGR